MLSFPKNSKLTIIGGAGRMGAFFANYFKAKGFSLTLSDVRKKEGREIAQKLEMDFVDDNKEAVKDADLVLVSVPIKDINEVILEVASHMKKGSVLAEISSIKGPLIDSLHRLKPMGLQPLSLHPLFGPTVKSLKGNSVVLIPVLEGDIEMRLALKLFEEAKIIKLDWKEHDEAMAVVLSLSYFVNLAFARILDEVDLVSLKKLAGTTFTVQLTLIESVVNEDPHLIKSFLMENDFSKVHIKRFINAAEELRTISFEKQDSFEKVYASLKKSLARDPDFLLADERRYKAFEALRT
jgi:prephenate dehydrogenase